MYVVHSSWAVVGSCNRTLTIWLRCELQQRPLCLFLKQLSSMADYYNFVFYPKRSRLYNNIGEDGDAPIHFSAREPWPNVGWEIVRTKIAVVCIEVHVWCGGRSLENERERVDIQVVILFILVSQHYLSHFRYTHQHTKGTEMLQRGFNTESTEENVKTDFM
jgi:hypothetical protein